MKMRSLAIARYRLGTRFIKIVVVFGNMTADSP